MPMEKKVLVIRHSYCNSKKQSRYGHVGHLVTFLTKKYGNSYEIIHPFFYSDFYNSHLILHDKRKERIVKEFPTIKIPEFLFYVKDFLATIYLIFTLKKKFKIIVGADPLNALTGVFFKKLGFVDKVIFYVIDYTPKRFENRLMNFLYQFICKKAAKLSDCTWNLSQRMADLWSKIGVPDEKNIVVPGGMNIHVLEKKFFRDKAKRLVFFGDITESKGIELVIRAFSDILKKVPDCKLIVVGTGKAEKKMKRLAEELEIEKNVEFLGFIPEYSDVLDILSDCTMGLAPYVPTKDTITTFAEPLKIKEYLSCGLPLIMTGVPEIARQIENNGAGIVIKYDKKELVNAVVGLLIDQKKYKEYKKNVMNLASKYDWNTLFENALEKTCVSKKVI